MKFTSLLAAISALLFSVTAMSGQSSYQCVVGHIYDLNDNSELSASAFGKAMVGESFTVSRETGEVVGRVLPTFQAESTRVVNRGSSANSFKSVAFFDGQVQVLEVQEFKQGSKKPFIALSMGGAGLVTGTCE